MAYEKKNIVFLLQGLQHNLFVAEAMSLIVQIACCIRGLYISGQIQQHYK